MTLNLRRQTGFTLIEIIVVVVIIGILATLIAPQILGRVDEARVTAAKQDIRTLGTALDFYRMDNFKYPTTDQGLRALVEKPDDPSVRNWRPDGYLKARTVPKDPWGNEYRYLSPGTRGGPYDLYSFGGDGEQGGEGSDADIGSWNLEETPGE
jgi:general secretion pathway protein G